MAANHTCLSHTVFMSPLLIFVSISFSALVTSFISGILGMAGGMILMGVLLALMPVPAAMMLHGITQFTSNGWRAWLWRTNVNWRVFRGYAFGLFFALVAFAALQWVVSKPVAYVILGLTPFITFVLPKELTLNVDHRAQPFICGLICTALQLVAGVSGPLLDVFFVRSAMDRRGVVATKAMAQTLGHLTKIIFFGGVAWLANGEAKNEISAAITIPLAVTCVVLAFTGTSLSKRVLERMTDANFRLWTQWTVLTTGTIYLISGIWMLVKA
jgi:uncharacterized membrane protein YfcA